MATQETHADANGHTARSFAMRVALREALSCLDETVEDGGNLTEEVLDRIFASFCIGK